MSISRLALYSLSMCRINIRERIPKMIPIMLVTIITLVVNYKLMWVEDNSYVGAIVYLNGGCDIESTTLLQILVGLFRYVGIMYVCLGFIENMYSLKSQFLLIRIRRKEIYDFVNMLSCAMICVIMSVVYDVVNAFMCVLKYGNCDFAKTGIIVLYNVVGVLGMLAVVFAVFRLSCNIAVSVLLAVAILFLGFNSVAGFANTLCLGNFVMIGNLKEFGGSVTSVEFLLKNLIYVVVFFGVSKIATVKSIYR